MIGLGMIAGGLKVGLMFSSFGPIWNRAFARNCRNQYCQEIDDFHIVFFISGDITDFQFRGFRNVRCSYKRRNMTVKFGIAEEFYTGKTDQELKDTVNEVVREAIHLFIQRLKKDKVSVDTEQLWADFEKAFQEAKVDYN